MHKHWPLLVLFLLPAVIIAFSQTVDASCGDYTCEPPSESRYTCPSDCSCGDNIKDDEEGCDPPGSQGTCPPDQICGGDCWCAWANQCGNGVKEPAVGEACDGYDGCSSGYVCWSCQTCVLETCGSDGTITPPEVCDLSVEGQGCGGIGSLPGISAGGVCTYDCSQCISTPTCGDGYWTPTEETCDASAAPPYDGCWPGQVCSPDCTQCQPATCSNNQIDAGEGCDETAEPNGCTSGMTCMYCNWCQGCGDWWIDSSAGEICEPPGEYYAGWGCEEGTVCANDCLSCVGGAVCGNGIIESGEACDDGNTISGDGCSYASCQIESGWQCNSQPSVCTLIPYCGDENIDPGEACDPPGYPSAGCIGIENVCDENCQCTSCGNNACDNGENVNTCPADCHPICGNNFIEAGEQCDPPGYPTDGCPELSSCDGDCKGCHDAICGNYAVELPEVCDPPLEPSPACPGGFCGSDCLKCAKLVTGCTVIDQPGQYLLANDIINATPSGGDPTPSGDEPACIYINATDVVLDCQGYTIDGGLHPPGGTWPTEWWGSGVRITEFAPRAVVKNCQLSNWGFPMPMYGGGGINVKASDAVITGNTFYDNDVGLRIAGTAENEVTNTVAENNVLQSNMWDSVFIVNSSYTTLQNNQFYGNGGGTGLYMTGYFWNLTHDNVIRNNYFEGHAYSIYAADAAYRTTIDGNTVIGRAQNTGACIQVQGGSEGPSTFDNVTGNTVENCYWGFVLDSSYASITKNVAKFTSTGFGVPGRGSYTTIADNIATNNLEGFAIASTLAHDNILERNNASDNTFYGIHLTGSKNNRLGNNIVKSNSRYGIYLQGIDTGGGSNSVGLASSGGGEPGPVFCNPATNNSLEGNTIEDSGVAGIVVDCGSNNIISDSVVTKGTGASTGIWILGSNSTNNTLDGAFVESRHCESTGILIENASGNILNSAGAGADYSSGPGAGCSGLGIGKGIVVKNGNYNEIISPNVYDYRIAGIELDNASFTSVASSDTYWTMEYPAAGSGASAIVLNKSNNNNITKFYYIQSDWVNGGKGIVLEDSNSNRILPSAYYGSWSAEVYGKEGISLTRSNDNYIAGGTIVGKHSTEATYGIALRESSGNTLINNRIAAANGGAYVLMSNSNGNTLSGMARATCYNCNAYTTTNVIKLSNSNNNQLLHTNLVSQEMSGATGVSLDSSTGNSINDVISSANYLPGTVVTLTNSPGNTIENLNVYAANYGVKVANSSNTIIARNFINGLSSNNIGKGAGILLDRSNNVVIDNTNVSKFCTNVFLLNSSYVNIKSSNISYAEDKTGSNCLTPSGRGAGIFATSGSKNNTFNNNTVTGNRYKGVWLKEASVTNISTITSYNNLTGISDSDTCLRKDFVGNTTAELNYFENCGEGISGYYTQTDPIAHNTFVNCLTGIHFDTVTDSQVYDNNFINTARPIVLEGTSGNTFSNNVGSGAGTAMLGMTPADTFTNNVIGELTPTTVSCGQTLTTSTKMANSISCSGNGLTLAGDNIFLDCNGKSLTGVRSPMTLLLRSTGVTVNGDNDMVTGCNITGFALAVDFSDNKDIMVNNKLNKNAKGVSFINYLLQTFMNNDWDP